MLPFLTPFFRNTSAVGTAAKFVAGAAILVLYNLVHDPLFSVLGAHSGMGGGPAASFGYLAAVLFAAGLKDLQGKAFKSKKINADSPDALKKLFGILPYAVCSAVFYALGFVVANVLKLNTDYNATTAPYIFVAFTKFQAIYFILYAANKFLLQGRAVPLLSSIGRNILLYMLISTLLTVALEAVRAGLPQISFEAAFLSVPILTIFFLIVAIPLEKKKTLFKL
jgi:hypothetical protein